MRAAFSVRLKLTHTCMILPVSLVLFFFLTDTATTEIYTLSLHDALPIYRVDEYLVDEFDDRGVVVAHGVDADRKSTRLNSSHMSISYAVFCLKKKKSHHTLRKANQLLRRVSDCAQVPDDRRGPLTLTGSA